MKRTEFFGVSQDESSIVVSLGQRPPAWPDIDTVYGADGLSSPDRFRETSRDCAGAKAFCLSPRTDHDLVYLHFDDQSEPVLLGPGVLVRHSTAKKFWISPAYQLPATRLTSAKGRAYYGRSIQLPSGQSWELDPEDDNSINNTSNADVQLYEWDGSGWVPGDIAEHTGLARYVTIGGTKVDARSDALGNRPADVSPDGVLSFADYIARGVILDGDGEATAAGDMFASSFDVDSNGNPGDTDDPATRPFVDAFESTISALWYGAAAIEVWTEDPCGYQPRLAPQRIVVLRSVDVQPSPEDGVPDQVLLTVPGYNVEAAQLTWQNDSEASDGTTCATLASPVPGMPIDQLAPVTATPTATTDNAGGGAVAILQNVNPLIQIQVGCTADPGIGVIRQAVLTLTRKHIG
jgi:hypothetical protein